MKLKIFAQKPYEIQLIYTSLPAVTPIYAISSLTQIIVLQRCIVAMRG